jgi:tRNA dimethylallyltransferase
MPSRDVIILTGATASGKSALALKVAKQKGGVILNADSMQLYHNAPILTAQPSAEDVAAIPHRLYGIRDAAHACSVAQWVDMAATELRACWQEGALPIVVGGTGMYIRALMQGLNRVPPIPEDIRTEVRSLSREALRMALEREDAHTAAHLRPSDTQRSARALEVIRATGKSLHAWHAEDVPIPPLPEARFNLYCTQLERSTLYDRINMRTQTMLTAGGLQEAEALHARNLPRSLPLLRAVGVAELLTYLDGNDSWEATKDAIAQNTRRYAKRQLTWMRHQFPDAVMVEGGCPLPDLLLQAFA